MVFVTYPDGTQEVHDSGLTIRVRRERVVSSSLHISPDQEAYALNVSLGDPKSVGYTWVRQTHRKWVDQMAGKVPFLTESGAVWYPNAAARDARKPQAS